MKIDPNRRYINVTKAIGITFAFGLGKPSRPTITSWVQKYDLGTKVGGRWHIDEQLFKGFLKHGNKQKKGKGVKSNTDCQGH